MTRPTIRKILRDRESSKEKLEELTERNKVKKTNDYKKKWLELRETYPNLHRKELSNLNRAAYAWLNNYDKDWLEENSPPSMSGKKSKKKVYSKDEDIKNLEKVKKIIDEWSGLEQIRRKLVRKSRHQILLLMGYSATYNRTDLLPITFNYMQSIEESVLDFRKRKVRNVLATTFQNEEASFSQVAESAGVRACIRKGEKEISEYIKYLLKQHN